jgi:hypothetical protein
VFRTSILISYVLLAGTASVWADEPQIQDPMRPPVAVVSPGATPSAETGLHLTAVLVSETRRIAVINGKFYGVGDFVNGEQITRIEPGSVHIRRGGQPVLVTVQQPNPVKKDGDPNK